MLCAQKRLSISKTACITPLHIWMLPIFCAVLLALLLSQCQLWVIWQGDFLIYLMLFIALIYAKPGGQWQPFNEVRDHGYLRIRFSMNEDPSASECSSLPNFTTFSKLDSLSLNWCHSENNENLEIANIKDLVKIPSLQKLRTFLQEI